MRRSLCSTMRAAVTRVSTRVSSAARPRPRAPMSGVGGWEGAVSVPCNAVCVLDPNSFPSLYLLLLNYSLLPTWQVLLWEGALVRKRIKNIRNHMAYSLLCTVVLLSFAFTLFRWITQSDGDRGVWLVALASVTFTFTPRKTRPAARRADAHAACTPDTGYCYGVMALGA